MRKLLFYIISFCLTTLSGVNAQNAREILDHTAARLTQSGGIRAQFRATQFIGTTPQSETAGTMLISGPKYYMQTNEISVWYDGETQWSKMTNSNEVNVSAPNQEAQATINPMTLVGLYKKGYDYSYEKSRLRDQPTYVIHLSAKSKKMPFSHIFIDVEQATYNPLCIRAKKDGDWLRLSIITFLPGQKFPESTFSFPEKDNLGIEVIDLR